MFNRCLNQDQIEAFVSGMLSPKRRSGMDRHLAGCPKCREAVRLADEEHRLIQELRRMDPSIQVPPTTLNRITDAVSTSFPGFRLDGEQVPDVADTPTPGPGR